jgi:phosphoglycolate phosphatase-like HAD superfamily hydrolase
MKKYRILVLDLHNTLYDEVMEYGLAMDAAMTVWFNAARTRGQCIDRQRFYDELSVAHQDLGSDWDDNVWNKLPLLQAIGLTAEQFHATCHEAIICRREQSKTLTEKGVYADVRHTLFKLKVQGVSIYVITEAAADVAMQSIEWLGLAGIVDGVYSYPSRNVVVGIENTYHKSFPLKKPHPFLLAGVIIDDAKRSGAIPSDIPVEDLFEIRHDPSMMLVEFDSEASIQQDISAQLIVKLGPYKTIIQKTIESMLYVGDSKFKDGLLARNAGVSFGFAAYGKKIKKGEDALFEKSKSILYAVTGWDKETLRLTQEACQSAVVNALQPDFTFESGLSEIVKLFNS